MGVANDKITGGIKLKTQADPIADATKILGHAPTDAEMAYINREIGNVKGETFHTGVSQLQDVYAKLSGEIKKQGAAVGLTLTPDQIQNISSSIFDPSTETHNLADGAVRQFIVDSNKGLIQQNLANMKVDQLKNPAITDQHTADANRVFQNVYGRPPDPDEAQYFAKELAQGKTPYELKAELQSLPEYQNKLAADQQAKYKTESQTALDQLNQNLQGQQQVAFQRAIPQILGSYMRAGVLNSSGVDNAVAQQMAELDRQRQSYIGGLDYQNIIQGQNYSRQDFVNNNANAFNQYLQQNAPYQQTSQALSPYNTFAMQQQGLGGYIDRSNQISDYNRQQSDYERYFNQNQQQANRAANYSLLGSLLGAGGTIAGGYLGRA